MMKEQLISFETAKLAKEKGFDCKCDAFYGKYNDNFYDISKLIDDNNYSKESYQLLQKRDYGIYAIQVKDWNSNTIWCDYDVFCRVRYSAPTQSLLQKWLRDEHGISIRIDDFVRWNKLKFDYTVCSLGIQNKESSEECYLTYEEALEMALQEALKLV